MLYEFEQVGVFDFLPLFEEPDVASHLFFEVEGEKTKEQLVTFFLAPNQVLSGGDGPDDHEIISNVLLLLGLLLPHRHTFIFYSDLLKP